MLGEVVDGASINESLGNGRSGALFLALGPRGLRLVVERLHAESDWGAFAVDAKSALGLPFLPAVTESVSSGGTRVLVAHVDLSPSAPVKRGRSWVGVPLLLLLLPGAWALLRRAEVEPPPPTVTPAPMAETLPTPEPVDARATAPTVETPVKPEGKNPPALTVKIPKTNIQVEKVASACTFDDRYLQYARRHRTEMLRMDKKDEGAFSKADDKLTDALVEKDCRRANTALDEMSRLVIGGE